MQFIKILCARIRQIFMQKYISHVHKADFHKITCLYWVSHGKLHFLIHQLYVFKYSTHFWNHKYMGPISEFSVLSPKLKVSLSDQPVGRKLPKNIYLNLDDPVYCIMGVRMKKSRAAFSSTIFFHSKHVIVIFMYEIKSNLQMVSELA